MIRKAAESITVEFLRECFEYREGVIYWRERPPHHFQSAAHHATFIKKSAGKPAGRKEPKGYVCVKFRNNGNGVCISAHRIIWAMHHGAWPKLHLDHINRVRSDNRIENLREVTPAENAQNSSWKRVHPYVSDYHHGRFVAWTNIGGQETVHLGIFDTEAEAIAHRDLVNAELVKLAKSLVKKTPRPKTYRKRVKTPPPSREKGEGEK
jgi:hypothetical protein